MREYLALNLIADAEVEPLRPSDLSATLDARARRSRGCSTQPAGHLDAMTLLGGFLVPQRHHEPPFLRLRELRHPACVTGLLLHFLHYPLSNATNDVFPIFAERSLGLPGGALATLQRTVDQQSQLLSCDDLYRMLAVLACITAGVVLVQRRLQ